MKNILLFLSLLAASFANAANLTITAASVVPGPRAIIVPGVLGVAVTAGQLVYFDSTSQTYKLADADASAATAAVAGIAVAGGAAGQTIGILTQDDDLTIGGTLSMTAPVYVLSATAGAIAPTADITTGMYPCVVLVAKSTTKCVFRINLRGTAPAS